MIVWIVVLIAMQALLIIDLEDGCPDDKKIDAREELIGLLKKGNVFTKPLFVRVNDAMNENGRQDIDALSDYEDQIEAIILPKTQSFDFLGNACAHDRI